MVLSFGRYINGPLKKWRHESEAGLQREADPAQRKRYEKHIAISNAIGKPASSSSSSGRSSSRGSSGSSSRGSSSSVHTLACLAHMHARARTHLAQAGSQTARQARVHACCLPVPEPVVA